MNYDEVHAHIAQTVDLRITDATVAGSALSLSVVGEPRDHDSVSFLLMAPWIIEQQGSTLTTNDSFGFYECSFDSEEKWREYQATAAQTRALIATVVGTTLEGITLDPVSWHLALSLSGGFRVRSSESSSADWSFRSKPQDCHFSVSSEGIHNFTVAPGEKIAERNFAFLKDGTELPAHLTVCKPVSLNSDQDPERSHCSILVTTPFGTFNTGSAGHDSVSALLFALQIAKGQIERLAVQNGAVVCQLDEDMEL